VQFFFIDQGYGRGAAPGGRLWRFAIRWANTLYSKRAKDVKTNSLLTRIATTKGVSLCELMKS
jgi:hypothetical protein